jgi:aminobenzoyl-glutamate transport protein
MQRILDGVERAGNKVPHPAIIFLALCVVVIVLSQILAAFDVKATYEVIAPPPVETEQIYQGGSVQPSDIAPPGDVPSGDYKPEHVTTKVKGLLSSDGIRFLFTSPVTNFLNFAALAVILVVMVGVGLAEQAGLIAALIRKLVASSPPVTLTFIIVLLGLLSSVASDAGYLVLIPLGGAAFYAVGRHPLAGIAAAFAGVGAGFGVNFLITPIDGILTEITNESIHLVNPGLSIDLTANLYFGIGSTLLIALVGTFVTERMVEKRLGPYDKALASPEHEVSEPGGADDGAATDPADESRGLRYALFATLGVLALIAVLTIPSGAPLRSPETGKVIGTSPFMDSILIIITLVFFASGIAYGYGAKTLRGSAAIIGAVTKTYAGLAGLLVLFLLLAQFIAYFNYTNMAQVGAVKLGDILEHANIGSLWLLLGFILLCFLVNFFLPQAIAKWAILAPIFIPLLLRLNVAPQTVLAAFRLGDSPSNVLTPLMAYFPLIVVVAKRYERNTGIGTVISVMLPFALLILATWTLLFVVWYLLGIPLGPGAPVHLH